MILHPNGKAKTVLTNVDEAMEAQHALDIRIEKLYRLSGMFTIDEDNREHRSVIEQEVNNDGYFELYPGELYTFDSSHKVEMADGEAAFIIGRSTLNRNGVLVNSSLYDAGYNGGVNGTIQNRTKDFAMIKKGTRIGQFIIMKADTVKLYDGVYNEPKQEEKKDDTSK